MCEAPGCLRESWNAYRAGASFLKMKGVARPQQTFETFRETPENKESFEAMKALATGKSNFFLLLIYGGVGNGKTHLANAMTIFLNEHGQDCRYFIVADLMSSLRGTIAKGESVDDLINTIRDFSALILDDYKPDLGTAFEQDVVEQIINHRYAFMLPTVLITNADWKSLPERIVSRFSEPGVGKVILNGASDYRAGAT